MKNLGTQYLELDRLEANPRLVGQLSPDLARRYHALPVAEDGEHITVAMANPDDTEAREAISAALGKSTCVVRADIHAIDNLLAELWPDAFNHSPRLLAWRLTDSKAAEAHSYAQALADLLGADLNLFETLDTGGKAYIALAEKTELVKADMVIYQAPCQPILKRLVTVPAENKLADYLSVSLLLAREPRWPLKKILLVIRNEDSDEIAVNWAVRLAKPSGASVTVLPITIPIPAVYAHMQPSLPVLLTTDSPLGRKMRCVIRRLVVWEIDSTLRIRDDLPNWQIHNEVIDGNYDLIVIGAEPHNRLWRWLAGELIPPLLSWVDRPLLIAKSTTPKG